MVSMTSAPRTTCQRQPTGHRLPRSYSSCIFFWLSPFACTREWKLDAGQSGATSSSSRRRERQSRASRREVEGGSKPLPEALPPRIMLRKKMHTIRFNPCLSARAARPRRSPRHPVPAWPSGGSATGIVHSAFRSIGGTRVSRVFPARSSSCLERTLPAGTRGLVKRRQGKGMGTLPPYNASRRASQDSRDLQAVFFPSFRLVML